MRTVTDRFLTSLREAHLIASRCRLYFPGESDPVDVPLEAGEVTIDRTAQARRRASIQIPWSLQTGLSLGLDMRTLPLGGYALLERGLKYPDGSTELVLLGRLRVESVSWGTLSQVAELELADRMAQIRDEPFTAPFAAGGLQPADAARAIVHQVFGDSIGYDLQHDPPITLADAFYSDQRAEALTALEQAASGESYFDANGDFVFASKEPGPSVWTVDAGQTGVMIDADENLDRTGIYNGVLVEGQAAAEESPVSALAVDGDPDSPTLWGGPFGKVAMLAQSSSVQTAGQALDVAESLLRLRLKMTRSLTLTAAPNPALEAGDVITVNFVDGRSEEHLIDSVTVDLGTGSQQISTRSNFEPVEALAAPVRTFTGHAAWQQVHDADLVSA